MASESPFENLAGPLETDPPNRSVRIRPGGIETPFSLAHRGTGEWRNWRAVLELNGITSPFNIEGREQRGAVYTEPDPADLDGEDLFADLGLEIDVPYVSSTAPGAFSLYVEDTAEGYSITASLPGGSAGDAFVLIPDSVNGQEYVDFSAYVGDETVDLRLSSAGWLLFWLHRTLHLTCSMSPTRDVALIPSA